MPDPEPPVVDEGAVTGEELTETQPGTEPEPALPESVRQRVVALAATVIGGMPADEVPAALRKIASFAPNRRARLAGPAIAAQLAADPVFRQRVGARVLDIAGDLGAAIRDGTVPAAADPVDVAALAYLGRPSGWLELVSAAAETLKEDADSSAARARLMAAEHRAARAEHERAVAKVEAEKLRDELTRLRAEADTPARRGAHPYPQPARGHRAREARR